MKFKIMRIQKLMLRNIMRSTKSKIYVHCPNPLKHEFEPEFDIDNSWTRRYNGSREFSFIKSQLGGNRT